MSKSINICNLENIASSVIDSFLSLYFPLERDSVLQQRECVMRRTAGLYGILIDGNLQGVINWELLKWDTQFFKRPMARITKFLVPRIEDSLNVTTRLLSYTIDKCKENKIVHIDVSVEANNFLAHWALKNSGFIIVDVKATFLLALKEYSARLKGRVKNYPVRCAQDGDLIALKDICTDTFLLSRFYMDPFFTKQEANNLYRSWVENIMNQANSKVFIAEQNCKMIGFITCSIKEEYAIIDLIATRKEFHNKGVGILLVSKLIVWLKGKIGTLKVVTQIYNYPAINLYTKLGFNIERTEISYGREI